MVNKKTLAIIALTGALLSSKSIMATEQEALDLSGHRLETITVAQWRELSGYLEKRTKLKKLNLSNNWLGDMYGDNKWEILSDLLKKMTSLESLDLSQNWLAGATEKQLQMIFDALNKMPNLKKLNLEWNAFNNDQQQMFETLNS